MLYFRNCSFVPTFYFLSQWGRNEPTPSGKHDSTRATRAVQYVCLFVFSFVVGIDPNAKFFCVAGDIEKMSFVYPSSRGYRRELVYTSCYSMN